MELILWRHAEAEPGEVDESDEERVLTAKGRKQVIRMAEWLDRVLPANCRILASPARRTMQTAEALGRKFQTSQALGTGASAQNLLDAALAGQPRNGTGGRPPAHPGVGRVAADRRRRTGMDPAQGQYLLDCAESGGRDRRHLPQGPARARLGRQIIT
jgi:hypothetical protein